MAAFSTIALGVMAGAAAYGAHSSAMQKKTAKSQAEEQSRQIAKAEAEQAQQDKMVAEQTARESGKSSERRRRASSGRKGLLYGSATGVQGTTGSTTLGG